MPTQAPSPMLVFETLQAHQQTSALRAGMFAMTMLTTTPSGDAFSQSEIASMCTRAGPLRKRLPLQ